MYLEKDPYLRLDSAVSAKSLVSTSSQHKRASSSDLRIKSKRLEKERNAIEGMLNEIKDYAAAQSRASLRLSTRSGLAASVNQRPTRAESRVTLKEESSEVTLNDTPMDDYQIMGTSQQKRRRFRSNRSSSRFSQQSSESS